jgi:hypothetical protein
VRSVAVHRARHAVVILEAAELLEDAAARVSSARGTLLRDRFASRLDTDGEPP